MSYFGQAEGRILTADEAIPILAYFNIASDTQIDVINGMDVQYNGKRYTIMQAEYPIFGGSRPDGLHFVYQLSPDESAAKEPPAAPFDWNNVLFIAGLGIAAYVAVNFFGKKS
jgi:hypothetical protein